MLTLSQKKTFEFIKNFIEKQGHAPTISEIARGIGIHSRGVAHRYVRALAQKGFLHIVPNCHRNIELADRSNSNRFLTVIGNIAAGNPIEALPVQEELDLTYMLSGPNRFALRVKGRSMIDEGIFDGDVVICERSETAKNGQIVVALVDNQEATLKRLQQNSNNTVTLLPANADFSPQTYAGEQVKIQGIFIGLLRLPSRN